MYNAVAFSIFIMLYNHHLYLVPNIFTIPKGKSVSIMQSPTLPTLSNIWQLQISLCLYGFAHSGYFIWPFVPGFFH